MNAKERCKMRRKLRRASEREESQKDTKLGKSIATSLSGCSSRVNKAVSLIDYKASPRSLRAIGIERDDNKTGATCLQDVAIFNAGYRKSNQVTAR
ncbi:hypothetical protein A8A01_03290 [Ewingella americana]|nr:hypothetical protein A8A01_03290 [Ewingella americana]